MKKHFKRTKVFYPLMVFIAMALTSISATPALWPSTPALSSATKQDCMQFKLLQGNNRVAEFKKIVENLFEQTSFNATAISTNQLTFSNLEQIFGKPDMVLQNGDWLYSLTINAKNNKAIFNVDKLSQVIYCTITDCD